MPIHTPMAPSPSGPESAHAAGNCTNQRAAMFTAMGETASPAPDRA